LPTSLTTTEHSTPGNRGDLFRLPQIVVALAERLQNIQMQDKASAPISDRALALPEE
jgi:hypothetical protein